MAWQIEALLKELMSRLYSRKYSLKDMTHIEMSSYDSENLILLPMFLKKYI